jgi:hypothetical protein
LSSRAQPRDLLFAYVNKRASGHSHKDVSQRDANPHETPAPKGRKKTTQDEVHDASPDEVLGKTQKKFQAPHGSQTDRAKNT